jgi:threonine/homoserine/homoserine lactone efflux protein
VISDGHLAGFALVSLALIVVPGPNVLFVVSRSLMLGRGAGVATAAGGQIGASLQVAAVAFGIGELVERSAAVFTVIKLAGAAYLAYLGVQAFRHRHSLSAALDARAQRKNVTVIVRDGIVVGVSNPKVIVFFVAVLPQFVDRSAGHVPLQMLLLGAVWSAIALVCDSSWALAAGNARAWLARSPRRLAAVGGAGGLAMIGIGVGLALTGRKD